jgi:hypothetical protein
MEHCQVPCEGTSSCASRSVWELAFWG